MFKALMVVEVLVWVAALTVLAVRSRPGRGVTCFGGNDDVVKYSWAASLGAASFALAVTVAVHASQG